MAVLAIVYGQTKMVIIGSWCFIVVLQDKDRMDVMRALVTGPTGTPYSLGCFCFDIYFPTSYPNVPPLVKIITTGNGTVRSVLQLCSYFPCTITLENPRL